MTAAPLQAKRDPRQDRGEARDDRPPAATAWRQVVVHPTVRCRLADSGRSSAHAAPPAALSLGGASSRSASTSDSRGVASRCRKLPPFRARRRARTPRSPDGRLDAPREQPGKSRTPTRENDPATGSDRNPAASAGGAGRIPSRRRADATPPSRVRRRAPGPPRPRRRHRPRRRGGSRAPPRAGGRRRRGQYCASVPARRA